MNVIHDSFSKPYTSKPSVTSFLICVNIPKHSFTKTRRFASVACSRDLSIRRQAMGNREPVAYEGRVEYCPVVYGMSCIEDHNVSRGAPASLQLRHIHARLGADGLPCFFCLFIKA